MFFMMLYQCGRTLADNRTIHTPIITLFLRDGVFWFLAIFVISLADLIVWVHGHPGLAQANDVPGTVLFSVIGTRVLLGLKCVTSGVSVNTTAPTYELGSRTASGTVGFSRPEDTRDL
ncbi:hypothetical protein B0H17DRAFT_1125215 [Mycena rosella]|uniref:Uncharacterized protein n=1 Tax=Mycena rosella TaxID=1033263 RepID=A0AAD7MA47_MYCRO|nr:hypothetical protein B0H17DRAFT_1125215 [Mycena rosella]